MTDLSERAEQEMTEAWGRTAAGQKGMRMSLDFRHGFWAAREYSKQREDELLRAVKAAAHAAFDYATESDEHGDRFAMWWGVYSHEALAESRHRRPGA